MADKKVLVLCATGKMGKGVAHGLVASGFEVYGASGEAAVRDPPLCHLLATPVPAAPTARGLFLHTHSACLPAHARLPTLATQSEWLSPRIGLCVVSVADRSFSTSRARVCRFTTPRLLCSPICTVARTRHDAVGQERRLAGEDRRQAGGCKLHCCQGRGSRHQVHWCQADGLPHRLLPCRQGQGEGGGAARQDDGAPCPALRCCAPTHTAVMLLQVDVAKANGIEFLIFLSVADLEPMQVGVVVPTPTPTPSSSRR